MGKIRKAGDIYFVDFRIIREKKSITFFDPKEAAAFFEMLQNRRRMSDKNRKPILEAVAFYIDHVTVPHKSCDKRDTSVLNHLNTFLISEGIRSIGAVKPHHVEQFQTLRASELTNRGRPRQSSTVNRDMSPVRNFFKKCVQWGYCNSDPSLEVEKLKETENLRPPMTEEEFEILIEYVRPWLRDVLFCMRYTGARRGAICGLRWSDIDMRKNTIRFLTNKGKGNSRYYSMPMNDELRQLISRLSKSKRNKEFVFCLYGNRKVKGRRLRADHVTLTFRRALNTLGLDNQGITLHGMRHWFATRLDLKGAPTKTVKDLMGHRNISTTQKYMHANPEQLARWVAAI